MDDLYEYFIEQANKSKKEKKYEEAIKFLDEAQKIRDDERSDDFWYKKGLQFSKLGEYEKSIECLDKELASHEKNYKTYFLRGKILFQLQKYPEAIESFNKASETAHNRYLKNVVKSEHLKKVHRFEDAIISKDESEKETQLDETFWYWKGLTFLRLEKFDDASFCFDSYLQLKNDLLAMYYLTKSVLLTGDVNKSLVFVKQICDLQPQYKEKFRNDPDFFRLSENKQFRMIIGL